MASIELQDVDCPTLIEALESGAETEITLLRDGEPVVRMVAISRRKPVRLGLGDGKFTLNIEEFDRLDAGIERLFEESARNRPLTGPI